MIELHVDARKKLKRRETYFLETLYFTYTDLFLFVVSSGPTHLMVFLLSNI